LDSGARKHFHEHVDAEEFDLASDEIAYAWLRDSHELCRGASNRGLR